MSMLNAPIGMSELLALSAFLFAIGLYGLFTRRGIIAILMCIELMLNAVNLNLIAFDRLYVHDGTGAGHGALLHRRRGSRDRGRPLADDLPLPPARRDERRRGRQPARR